MADTHPYAPSQSFWADLADPPPPRDCFAVAFHVLFFIWKRSGGRVCECVCVSEEASGAPKSPWTRWAGPPEGSKAETLSNPCKFHSTQCPCLPLVRPLPSNVILFPVSSCALGLLSRQTEERVEAVDAMGRKTRLVCCPPPILAFPGAVGPALLCEGVFLASLVRDRLQEHPQDYKGAISEAEALSWHRLVLTAFGPTRKRRGSPGLRWHPQPCLPSSARTHKG